MKIRGGFVSNSSSSSFIITIPKDEKITFESVSGAMFPGMDITNVNFDYYDYVVTGPDAVATVVADLRSAGAATDEQIGECIHGSPYGVAPSLQEIIKEAPDYDMVIYGTTNYRMQPKLTDDEQRAGWDKYHKVQEEWTTKAVATMREHWKDFDIYVVEYSDNDGGKFCAMEHGGVFDKMIESDRAIRMSHH